jgi:transposase
MLYKIGAIDVHKKVLMVVVVGMESVVPDETAAAVEFECRKFGAGAAERKHIVSWLQEQGVREVVMESTAQYWKPLWLELEPHFDELHLAQAQSNRAPKGRKDDFKDAKRLGRRLLSGELQLSFVPDAEQRLWRHMTRGRLQLIRERVRLQNKPTGSVAGGSKHQAVERGERLAWSERPADPDSAERGGE